MENNSMWTSFGKKLVTPQVTIKNVQIGGQCMSLIEKTEFLLLIIIFFF